MILTTHLLSVKDEVNHDLPVLDHPPGHLPVRSRECCLEEEQEEWGRKIVSGTEDILLWCNIEVKMQQQKNKKEKRKY